MATLLCRCQSLFQRAGMRSAVQLSVLSSASSASSSARSSVVGVASAFSTSASLFNTRIFDSSTKSTSKAPQAAQAKPPGAIAVESAKKVPKAPIDDKCGPLPDAEDELDDMIPMKDPKTGMNICA